jgi:anaerobic magnesium-protoporphyrin IX monomethyl ester cyclase
MKLLLATLHAKYVHASLALPSLAACCSDLHGVTTVIREYTVNERVETILKQVVAEGADVAAFSCYIWNIEATLKLIADLKLVRPGTFVILGGPEVSYGSHTLLARSPFVDCIVRGEGEATFRELLDLLAGTMASSITDDLLERVEGISFRSGDEIITTPERAVVTDLDTLPSPFAARLVDTTKPLVYLETSRGCPFSCAFCLSSVEQGVRSYSAGRIEDDLNRLMEAGVQTIKLVDRTFNYDSARADRIWRFILGHNRTSRFHFEIAADLLTEENFRLLREVPAGIFRFEIGVQSAQDATLASVGRSSNLERLFANVRTLKEETGVVLHLDLVAGLPGEDFAGFTASLDRLLTATPHHIQVEPLKLLQGTRMRRIARESRYAWSPTPPYRILGTPSLDYGEICRIEEVSQALELLYNSGRFTATMTAIARSIPLATLFTHGEIGSVVPGSGGQRLLGLFVSLLHLLRGILPATAIPPVLDALRFDYCMAGHPGQAMPAPLAMPGSDAGTAAAPAPYPELARRLSSPPGSRFKTFTLTFNHNHTCPSAAEGAIRITFIYAANGSGAAVHLLTEPAPSF